MLEIASARKDIGDNAISNIGFLRSSKKISDGLTKQIQQDSRHKAFSEEVLDVLPEKWIVRTKMK